MHIVVYAALAIVALYMYVFLRRRPRKGQRIPGPNGWPIVGQAFKMKRETMHEMCFELAKEYGDIFRLNAFGKSIVLVNDAEMIRSMFCDEAFRNFTNDKPKIFYGHWVLFGSKSIFSFLNARNSPHTDLRKTFTRGMHVYGEGIGDFEAKVQSELGKLCERIESFDGRAFDIEQLLLRSLSNVTSILLSGNTLEDTESGSNIFWDYDRSVDTLVSPDVDVMLMTFPFLRLIPGMFKRAFDTIIQARAAILDKYFYDAKKTYQHGRIRGLVDFYLAEQRQGVEEGRPFTMTDEHICAQILETVATGIITTLSTLTALFLCLLNHPEYQTKIQAELDGVVGRMTRPSISDKHECVMLEAVCLEVQRYITVVPLSVPHFCKPDIGFQDYHVPENSIIFPNIWFIHHDEKVWGDPWTFRPERWLDDEGHLLPNDHVLRRNWMPFGVGRRQCIGESLARSRLFLYVATLLQRWNFDTRPEHHVSCDPRAGNLHVEITCRPKPYLCRAVPRTVK